jgi:hypothetical protein
MQPHVVRVQVTSRAKGDGFFHNRLVLGGLGPWLHGHCRRNQTVQGPGWSRQQNTVKSVSSSINLSQDQRTLHPSQIETKY